MKAQTKETQSSLTPENALDMLVEGNSRYVKNIRAPRDLKAQVSETGTGQFPFAAILGCIDSRVSPELLFDQGIGDIFSVRVAGNIVNEDVLGSLEYACKVAGSKLILVLGHTGCGAVAAACRQVELGNITALLEKIGPAVQTVRTSDEPMTGEEIERVTLKNVRHSMEMIRRESPILAKMEVDGEIEIVGALYNVEDGVVRFRV